MLMGKRNLAGKIIQEARTDSSGSGIRRTSAALIWGKGHVLPDGSPAKGFYIDEKMGPVVQAVPADKYRDFVRQGGTDEKAFAAENMRQFSVIIPVKTDFNALHGNAHKYDLIINGDFFTETIATPVLKTSVRTLESTVPDGESFKRKQINSLPYGTSRERINKIQAMRGDDSVGERQFYNADGSLSSRRPMFPREGDTWYSTIKTNPDKRTVALYRDNDPDSLFMEAGQHGQVKIEATDITIGTNVSNVSYGDLTENPLQMYGFSSVVTPIPRFAPNMKAASWISGLYDGLMDFFRDDDRTQYGDYAENVTYDHEIIDINDFRPNREGDE